MPADRAAHRPDARAIWGHAGYAFALLFPSSGLALKYLGVAGLGLYALGGVGVLLAAGRVFYPWFLGHFSRRQALPLAILTCAALMGAFAVIYPLADSGQLVRGSDADDGLNRAARALLAGRYPYYEQTYLGNAITPMPGAVVLATPFVLLGNSAYQNGFWLAIFFVALAHRLKDARAPLLLLWTVLLLSPVVLHALLTGNDYVANSLYILLPLAFLSDAVSGRARPSWRVYGALVFLGVALSSRANFLVLLPLVCAFLAHRGGARTAILYTGVVIAVFAGVTLPFYLHDPPHFSPLHTTHKLAQYESILPHAGLVVPTLGALAAVALSGTRLNRTLPQLFRNCAVVQAVLVVPVGVLATLRSQRLDLTEAGYGIFFLFFGVTAYWLTRFGALRRAARANPDGSGEP